MEAPVGLYGFDEHRLGKVLARKEADEDPVRISNSDSDVLEPVKPVRRGKPRVPIFLLATVLAAFHMHDPANLVAMGRHAILP